VGPAMMPFDTGVRKGAGSGRIWWRNNSRHGSRSRERKQWSATVAKIPLELSTWIAKCFTSPGAAHCAGILRGESVSPDRT
jgi:hypothetical protein